MEIKHRIGLGSKQIWMTDSWTQYEKWCLRICQTVVTKHENTKGQSLGSFFWVNSFHDMPSVVHEAIHCIDNWMQDIGISNDTEVRAYAVQDILTDVIAKTNKKPRKAK